MRHFRVNAHRGLDPNPANRRTTVKLEVKGIADGQPIPEKFAFGVFSEQDHMSFGRNRNPELVWEGAPEGTKSFVVVMFDPDVPSVADDVNQEGKTVAARSEEHTSELQSRPHLVCR